MPWPQINLGLPVMFVAFTRRKNSHDLHGWRKCRRIVGNNPCHVIFALPLPRKPVPDVFSIAVPDAILPPPSMESYHPHPCRRHISARHTEVKTPEKCRNLLISFW